MKIRSGLIAVILLMLVVAIVAAGGGDSPTSLPAGHPGHTMPACDDMPERPWDLQECYRTYENRYFDHSEWRFKTRPAFSICVNMAEVQDISGVSQVGPRTLIFIERSNCSPNPFARPKLEVYESGGSRDSSRSGGEPAEPPGVKPSPKPTVKPIAPTVEPPRSNMYLDQVEPPQSGYQTYIGSYVNGEPRTHLFGPGCPASGCPIDEKPDGSPCWKGRSDKKIGDNGYDGCD